MCASALPTESATAPEAALAGGPLELVVDSLDHVRRRRATLKRFPARSGGPCRRPHCRDSPVIKSKSGMHIETGRLALILIWKGSGGEL